MTIKILKEYTTLDKLDRTKQQIKDFKEAYTERNLLDAFISATESNGNLYNHEIVYCKLEAFPGGSQETDETHYSVEMLIEGYNVIAKIRFYISQSYEIDTRDNLWNVKEFKAITD